MNKLIAAELYKMVREAGLSMVKTYDLDFKRMWMVQDATGYTVAFHEFTVANVEWAIQACLKPEPTSPA